MAPITFMFIGPLYEILDEVNGFCLLMSVNVLFVEIKIEIDQ